LLKFWWKNRTYFWNIWFWWRWIYYKKWHQHYHIFSSSNKFS